MFYDCHTSVFYNCHRFFFLNWLPHIISVLSFLQRHGYNDTDANYRRVNSAISQVQITVHVCCHNVSIHIYLPLREVIAESYVDIVYHSSHAWVMWIILSCYWASFIFSTYISLNTVKPAHAVTSIKQSPVLKVTFFFSCHRTFHVNWTSFKRSPVL